MNWWDDDPDDSAEDHYEALAAQHIRVRPNPKANRPRTKRRPEHSDAVAGQVLGVDRGRFTVLVAEHSPEERIVTATKARELAKQALVTGERVRLVGDTSGEPGTLARIVGTEERSTLLRRSADDTDAVERVIVANADQMLIVVAAAQPEPRARLVDRYLVAAFDAGITPMLCVTKTDLADPAPFLNIFAGLDLLTVTSATDAPPLAELTPHLLGKRTVFVGHSGVGKSTLINALVPHARRATGVVNSVTGRGRHTSSSTVSLRFDAGAEHGWVIDTPGVRSFGLGHVRPENLLRGFGDLSALAEHCPRGCSHLAQADDCALSIALVDAVLTPAQTARLESFRRLLTSFES